MLHIFQVSNHKKPQYPSLIDNTTVNNITILGIEVCWPYAMFATIENVSCIIVLKQVIVDM